MVGMGGMPVHVDEVVLLTVMAAGWYILDTSAQLRLSCTVTFDACSVANENNPNSICSRPYKRYVKHGFNFS